VSDLIRDLDLPKGAAEILTSRLKVSWIWSFNNIPSHNKKKNFYQQDELPYCKDIDRLLLKIGSPRYWAEEWLLFIDSSKRSLKCAMLHEGNRYASLPIGPSTKLREE